MMRVLVIGEAEKEAAKRLVEFAAKPENHYKPGPSAKVPGDDPRYVLQLYDYRCVFTITESPEGVWRHLSVSVPAKDRMPHPAAVEEIAHLFGIEGKVEDWARKGHVAPHEREHCIVVVHPYAPDDRCQQRHPSTSGRCQLKAGHDKGHVFPIDDAFFDALDSGDIIVGRPPKKSGS